MQRLSSAPFNADSGIDQILRQPLAPLLLPEQQALEPAQISDRPRLETLFYRGSINDYVAAQLRPDLMGSEILAPAQFRAALTETRANLSRIAKANRRSAKKMGRLMRALQEECALFELLQMYWSALLQG